MENLIIAILILILFISLVVVCIKFYNKIKELESDVACFKITDDSNETLFDHLNGKVDMIEQETRRHFYKDVIYRELKNNIDHLSDAVISIPHYIDEKKYTDDIEYVMTFSKAFKPDNTYNVQFHKGNKDGCVFRTREIDIDYSIKTNTVYLAETVMAEKYGRFLKKRDSYDPYFSF
jgi:hypothetical protein